MDKGNETIVPIKIGHLKICLAAVIWGSLGIFIRAVDLPVTTIVFFRVTFATVAIFVIILARGNLSQLRLRKHRGLMILRGLGLTINWLLFFYALTLTTIANAVLLTYTAPIFIVFLSAIILKEKVELKTVFSLIVCMAGIVLIVFPGLKIGTGAHLIGMICALGSATTYGLLVIASKYLLGEYMPESLVFYESFVTFLVLAPFVLVNFSKPSSLEWLLLAIMGIAHTALAALLYTSGLKQIKAQYAGIFAYLDPLTAIILAFLFLSETPTAYTIIGGVFILTGGLTIIIQRRVEQPLIPD
ncbi:MAG TPA: hypothetical protein ENN38_04500 [Actinobacteria bacterium]|nr:hypothetical protein [Actinomycetota bacterium]